jgi:hypothetical protein
MESVKDKPLEQRDIEDLKLIRKMKQLADKGFDVELRKDKKGGYKAMKVNKTIITAE